MRHFPVQNVARATYREILEHRAQENRIDFAEGVATALTPIAFFERSWSEAMRPWSTRTPPHMRWFTVRLNTHCTTLVGPADRADFHKSRLKDPLHQILTGGGPNPARSL